MAGYDLGTTTAYASLEKTWAHLVAFSCWEQRCISHHSWFSDIPREILHQTEPGCFSVGSMHSDFHSSPGHLLTNEFEEWLPTSNRTILFATGIVSSFLWACAQANWNSSCFFVSTVFFCKPGSLSVHCSQAVDVLSWLKLVHQLTPPNLSSVVNSQGVYQLKTAWQGGSWFMIDPEKGWSPYTVSQATRAECLREPYSRIARSWQLLLPQWNTNLRSIQTYFADLCGEQWWIKLLFSLFLLHNFNFSAHHHPVSDLSQHAQ